MTSYMLGLSHTHTQKKKMDLVTPCRAPSAPSCARASRYPSPTPKSWPVFDTQQNGAPFRAPLPSTPCLCLRACADAPALRGRCAWLPGASVRACMRAARGARPLRRRELCARKRASARASCLCALACVRCEYVRVRVRECVRVRVRECVRVCLRARACVCVCARACQGGCTGCTGAT